MFYYRVGAKNMTDLLSDYRMIVVINMLKYMINEFPKSKPFFIYRSSKRRGSASTQLQDFSDGHFSFTEFSSSNSDVGASEIFKLILRTEEPLMPKDCCTAFQSYSGWFSLHNFFHDGETFFHSGYNVPVYFLLATTDFEKEIKKIPIANKKILVAIFTVLKLKSDPGSDEYNKILVNFLSFLCETDLTKVSNEKRQMKILAFTHFMNDLLLEPNFEIVLMIKSIQHLQQH